MSHKSVIVSNATHCAVDRSRRGISEMVARVVAKVSRDKKLGILLFLN